MVVMGWRSGCGCEGMEKWVWLRWDGAVCVAVKG